MCALRPPVLDAKRRLAEGYAALKARHDAGCPGVELCAAGTDLRDEVLRGLYEAALAGFEPAHAEKLRKEVALVAHGGYGRREVSPYSDVDMMVLCPPAVTAEVGPLAERLLCDVFDAGLILGHSVRTTQDACRLACQDPQICTSLVESRLLAGSPALFDDYLARFRRQVRSRRNLLLGSIEKARLEERMKFGETVYLLEPNVKRSRGGLRDIQMIRWVGQVRHGSPDPAELCALGVLSEEDAAAIGRATELLLWIRNELHFHAGRSSDVLDRSEQVRIAALRGYEEAAGMLPVELFMREYFRHTDQVSHVAARFVDKARPRRGSRVVSAVFGHRVEGGFRVGPTEIHATAAGQKRLRGDLTAIVRLVDLANLYDKQISPETWEVVRQEAPKLSGRVSTEAIRHFWSLLSHPARLGELLRGLHEVAILEKFIPGFRHARGLLQFNQYHKYTVDEHSLRAVEFAADFATDPGPFGQVYRRLSRKGLLHLALLIHDLGKGYPRDHCDVGREMAEDTARRLRLDPEAAETLAFLVHKHLLMNHIVFRRDTSDEQLLVRFAVEAGSPEVLEMLYLLTAADLGAVGPGAWNNWKAQVITDVYQRTMQHLAGESAGIDVEEYLEGRRHAVREALAADMTDPWFARHVEGLPAGYLNVTPPQRIAADLRGLRGVGDHQVRVRADYQPQTETVELTISTSEDITPGVFHKLTGALASQGLEILSAQINTLADGRVLDRFRVVDRDYAGPPPPERLAEISRALEASLHATSGEPPRFRRTWKLGGQPPPTDATVQTRVRTDNSTSDEFTILDVFAVDQPGLLYAVSRAIFELGLSVGRARIGTYLDQVVDVFYVTDQSSGKIHDESRLDSIRRRLVEVIESLRVSTNGS